MKLETNLCKNHKISCKGKKKRYTLEVSSARSTVLCAESIRPLTSLRRDEGRIIHSPLGDIDV